MLLYRHGHTNQYMVYAATMPTSPKVQSIDRCNLCHGTSKLSNPMKTAIPNTGAKCFDLALESVFIYEDDARCYRFYRLLGYVNCGCDPPSVLPDLIFPPPPPPSNDNGKNYNSSFGNNTDSNEEYLNEKNIHTTKKSCNLCPNGQKLSSPDAIIDHNTEITCAEVEDYLHHFIHDGGEVCTSFQQGGALHCRCSNIDNNLANTTDSWIITGSSTSREDDTNDNTDNAFQPDSHG